MAAEIRKLGRTGLEVGVIGLGVEHMTLSSENMDAVIDLAVSAGVTWRLLESHRHYCRFINTLLTNFK